MPRRTLPRPLFVDGRHLEIRPTGVGIWLRSILAEWGASAEAPSVRVLTRQPVEAPGALTVEPVSAPSALWHLVAAWRTIRTGGHYLSPDSFLVPLLVGRRATLVVHDLTPLHLPEAHTRRSRISHVLLLRLAARRAGCVVVPSGATRDDLLRAVPAAAARTVVIPEAARALPEPAGPPPPGPYVLYVGTIEPRKNVDVLVDAFRAAAPPDWRLVLVGKLGWLSDDARAALLEAIAADDRVEHRGYVEDAELAGLYAGAELFVYPSSYEGFGLPVLEAMSHGVATVTTDATALAEVAAGAGICVPLDDLRADLEATLGRLLRAPEERAELAGAGRVRAAQLTWAAAADAVLASVRST